MKKILLLFTALFGAAQTLIAQNQGSTLISALPEIQISSFANIHFLSPEPIQYVDISSHSVAGDLPVKNILRIKIIPDSLQHLHNDAAPLGVITVVGESFVAQYRLVFSNMDDRQVPSAIEIQPEQCRPLSFPGITLTTNEMKNYALNVLDKGAASRIRKSKAYGLAAQLNHIYTVGDHVFLDISYSNGTNLPYDIDELHFKIEDKKINKATNVQSVEIKPEWQLYPQVSFKKEYHNIYVFKKITFPDNKILNIELSEKQISGRTITLKVRYSDLLNADML